MLSAEQNELLTRVGPGTPMGQLLRRYWIPALLARELPEPDCPPVRAHLLGERLVAFRDTQGRVGLLDEFCAHRCASLFLGRNEENGLRCVFHGWKYDVEGHCVDMPNELPESPFKHQIHLTAYPVLELGGVIWAYLGPADKRPGPPAMEWTRAPSTHRYVSKTVEHSNYLQGIEGGIDTAHSSFLHNNNLADRSQFQQISRAPRLEVERTDYGFRYAGVRDLGDEGNYIRMYQFVLPFHQFRSHQIVRRSGGGPEAIPLIKGHMWVPMDEERTAVYNWMYAADEDKPLTPEFIAQEEDLAGRGPDGETSVRHRTRANDWLIDRSLQRTQTYTGIAGLNTQDLAVQESMGPIVDRTREHLGQTDKAIISLRLIFLEAIRDMAEGLDPPGVDPSNHRAVRAADLVLPKGVRWQAAAEADLVAVR